MTQIQMDIKNLKFILENMHTPEKLDEHPWLSSLLVKDFLERNPEQPGNPPGMQLVKALGELFSTIQPGSPPRIGKRLDSRWGEYGLLSALYFVPYQNGHLPPTSLREACGLVDESILIQVFGSTSHIPIEDIEKYKLVGNESQITPVSTLSDWHRKGLQKLVNAINFRENYLQNSEPSRELKKNKRIQQTLQYKPYWRILFTVFTILVLGALILWSVWKGQRILAISRELKSDVVGLQGLMALPSLNAFEESSGLLVKTREDLDLLQNEVKPFIWLGPYLNWVPVYGGDLASSDILLKLADRLLASVEHTHTALQPIVDAASYSAKLDPIEMNKLFRDAQPEMLLAQEAFFEAKQLRTEVQVESLSETSRTLIQNKLDPVMPLLEDGFSIITSLPNILGDSGEGPKTYLILAQNEDELRPTGGFITAVGKVVLIGGKIAGMEFYDSGSVDNWERPYPLAPWQLEQYMNSRVLVLRDSNWFTDFPTSALYAESLYAYYQSHSVDGVIAIDQQMLVILLSAIGPINVRGASEPITSDNVINYMRSAKVTPAGEPIPEGWTRKGFIENIARAVVDKVYSGDVSLTEFGRALLRGLDEHHILLSMDNATISGLLDRHGWNGSLKAVHGDFLMLVDSNIGFNKTNALVDVNLSYDVDLTKLDQPTGYLIVNHKNKSSKDVKCEQWGSERLEGEETYPINACYWNYMRIYLPHGTKLLDANPQNIPNEWMILGRGQSGRVDALEEEWKEGQTFGTLMVVPGDSSITLGFSFALPQTIIQEDPLLELYTYNLTVKKQPGTSAIPITIRIHLPQSATLESVSQESTVHKNDILIRTDLRVDRQIQVVFSQK